MTLSRPCFKISKPVTRQDIKSARYSRGMEFVRFTIMHPLLAFLPRLNMLPPLNVLSWIRSVEQILNSKTLCID